MWKEYNNRKYENEFHVISLTRIYNEGEIINEFMSIALQWKLSEIKVVHK